MLGARNLVCAHARVNLFDVFGRSGIFGACARGNFGNLAATVALLDLAVVENSQVGREGYRLAWGTEFSLRACAREFILRVRTSGNFWRLCAW